MEKSIFDSNTKLAVVYYNGGKPPHLFRICIVVTLSELKGQLDQINRQLNYRDTRRVDNVEYWRPSTDSVKSVRFSRVKLMNDDGVRTILIFGQYSTRGPIELDASLVRSVEQIQKSLMRPKNYEEIRALLNAPHEDINLDDPWSAMFYFIICFMLFLLHVLCCRIMFYLWLVICCWIKYFYYVLNNIYICWSSCRQKLSL